MYIHICMYVHTYIKWRWTSHVTHTYLSTHVYTYIHIHIHIRRAAGGQEENDSFFHKTRGESTTHTYIYIHTYSYICREGCWRARRKWQNKRRKHYGSKRLWAKLNATNLAPAPKPTYSTPLVPKPARWRAWTHTMPCLNPRNEMRPSCRAKARISGHIHLSSHIHLSLSFACPGPQGASGRVRWGDESEIGGWGGDLHMSG